jgi:RimJ/RimL family protein N-acetyltransferase
MTVPVLTTARLRLRPPVAADAAAIVAGVRDWDVAKWLAVVPHPYTAEDARAFLEVIVPAARAVWVIDDGGLAGIISVDGEIGYWLSRDRWGRGYATEAGRAVVDWHFVAGGGDLRSGYFDGNDRSGGVLAKLGFMAAGVWQKECLARGEMLLSHRVLLTRAGWRAGQVGLTFRPLGPGDLPVLTALVGDWAVVSNLGSWPWPPDPAFTARRAKPYEGPGFVWAILRRGEMVGTVSVTGPDEDAELGYALLPALHGLGLGGAAARAAIAHAFATRPIDRIKADLWADNAASRRLVQRAGFTLTHEVMEHSLARGEMTASETWHLARETWDRLAPTLEHGAKTG